MKPLRVGEWQPVASDNKSIYASLRSTDRERIPGVDQPGFEAGQRVSTGAGIGPLKPGDRPALLLGQADPVASPEVNAAGGFGATGRSPSCRRSRVMSSSLSLDTLVQKQGTLSVSP